MPVTRSHSLKAGAFWPRLVGRAQYMVSPMPAAPLRASCLERLTTLRGGRGTRKQTSYGIWQVASKICHAPDPTDPHLLVATPLCGPLPLQMGLICVT